MERWDVRCVQTCLVAVLMIGAGILPIIPVSGAVDEGPSIDWWDIELQESGRIDDNFLMLGPLVFDPVYWNQVSMDLPNIQVKDQYLLQIDGPDSIEPVLSMEGAQFTTVDLISSFSILVRSDLDINDLRSELGPYTRSIIPYHPLMKIEGALFHHISENDGKGEAQIVAGLYRYPSEVLAGYMESNSRSMIVIDELSGLMELTLEMSDVFQLASYPEVSHVSLSGIEMPDNDVAADIIDVTEIWDSHGLNGTGQIVAVCDTGLDTGSNSTMHSDFTGRIVRAYAYGRTGNWSDADIHTWDPSIPGWDYDGGHGTHVAGSVLGNGTASSGKYKGMAPNAGLVMQSVMSSTGSFSTPSYSILYGDAYRSGARIQTNSWSSRTSYGNYTWRSWQTDHFIWNNPDLVVLFSAGNRGSSGDYQVSTQASSKNVIAVGASENYRPTLGSTSDNISHMAYFSSKGPTWGDQRIKPDVVAPGTWILSTRSMLITDKWNHYWGNNATYAGINNNYAYMGGTSMSTPIAAGMTTLVRQYYTDMEDIDPSAALVKATLINGARPLSGHWSSIPNKNEGWGLVNLTNSLAASGSDAGKMKYIDNSTGLTTGATHSRLYTVASSSNDLVITLVWTDYPGSNTSSTKLLNDLDLKITAPDGTVYNGNDFSSPHNSQRDNTNNVERVVIPSPATGVYTVNVTGFSVTRGPQPYSFVISGNLSDAVGFMEWDREFVPANGTTASLFLSDSNLTGDGWINIKVNSSSDLTGEMINLTEVLKGGSGIGLFIGTVKIVTGTPSAGEVSVTGDEYITATYFDQFPSKTLVEKLQALVNPSITAVSHNSVGRTLTYQDKVTVTINGTSGWTSWFDVIGLSGRSNIPARDDGILPDETADDGTYTGEFEVPNLVQGNYTIKGYIQRPKLDAATGTSTELVRINTNIPRRPRNLSLSVVPHGNSLRLDWDSPGDVNLMSYIIQRADESSPGSGIPGTYSDVGSIPYNITHFVDTGLVDGDTYFYMISSFNVLGFRSEPCCSVWGIPSDIVAPWFQLVSPSHQSVISGIVDMTYNVEKDTDQIIFEMSEDRNNDIVPDGPWAQFLTDDDPGNTTRWDTSIRPSGIDEGEWFLIRARPADEVPNWNTTGPLGRFSIDNTPPQLLDINSAVEVAVNVSVYHLTGKTEDDATIVILQDGIEIRSLLADGNGDFEAYLTLEYGVNEFSVQSFDVYGNGPTNFTSDLYVVYDPDAPHAGILEIDPVTSASFQLDGSGSVDIGPASRLSGIWNYTWELEFWGETLNLYGISPTLHLTRPGTASVILTVFDAAGNTNFTTLELVIVDDISPVLDPIDDLHVLEDSTVDLRASKITDNDPQIREIGNFTWTFIGPETLIFTGSEVRFQFMTPGHYMAVLTVSDSGLNTGMAHFNATVLDITNPVVDAGEDATVIRGQHAEFSGFNTTDNDPDFPEGANFTWIIRGPDLVLYGVNISVHIKELGDYQVRLKVTDAGGNVQTEEILLQVVTDGVPPEITGTEPSSDGGPITPLGIFKITFDEHIDEDTLDDGVFLLGPTGMTLPIDIQHLQGDTYAITTQAELEYGKRYSIRITEGLKDLTGEPALFREIEYHIVPSISILKINDVNLQQVRRDGLQHSPSLMQIMVEFSSPVDPGIKLILEDESGVKTDHPGIVEGNSSAFELGPLEAGTYTISFNGTSDYLVPLDKDISFTLTIKEEVSVDPVTNTTKEDTPIWIFGAVAVGILLILLIVIIMVVMIKKKKGKEPPMEEGPPQPVLHQHIRPAPPHGNFGR